MRAGDYRLPRGDFSLPSLPSLTGALFLRFVFRYHGSGDTARGRAGAALLLAKGYDRQGRADEDEDRADDEQEFHETGPSWE